MRDAAVLAVGALLVIGGCAEHRSRLNAPPQGHSQNVSDIHEPYQYMVDNAMLADMSLADIHFVPHTDELNSLGLRRLDRYGTLMKIYGGTLHYETDIVDTDAISRRLEHVMEYLAGVGIEKDRIEVETGLARGRGMGGEEGVIVHANAITEEGTPAGAPIPISAAQMEASGSK